MERVKYTLTAKMLRLKLRINPDHFFLKTIVDNCGGGVEEELEEPYKRVRKELYEELKSVRFGVAPTAVYVNPTDACNANCPYCYIPEQLRRRGVSMSCEQLDDVVSKAEDLFDHFGVSGRYFFTEVSRCS